LLAVAVILFEHIRNASFEAVDPAIDSGHSGFGQLIPNAQGLKQQIKRP